MIEPWRPLWVPFGSNVHTSDLHGVWVESLCLYNAAISDLNLYYSRGHAIGCLIGYSKYSNVTPKKLCTITHIEYTR